MNAPRLLVLPALLLAASCAHTEPAEPGRAETTAEPVALPGTPAGRALCGAPPPACGPATTAPSRIAALLARPEGGPVVIEGTLAERDTRCTNSVPPSCASSLGVTQTRPGDGPKPMVDSLRLGPPHGCSEPANGHACCTLPPGARVRVTGTHEVTQTRWGADHVVQAADVCAVK
jgi:hypothetical protein